MAERKGEDKEQQESEEDLNLQIMQMALVHEEMERAREAAEAANRAKSEFLANMSHEIRTPMNAIIGMTELALYSELNPVQQEYLETIKTSSESLLTLLNDILDFSKIEAGKLDLENAVFDLRDTIGEVEKHWTPRIREKGLQLVCRFAADVPTAVLGDAGRLRQILINLISNAIKFTEVGEIAIEVECRSRTADEVLLHFAVRDTGIGIPADKQELIFQSFSQADSSTTRKYGGTGLGLAICAQLTEMMGGAIWLESQEGEGSMFYFTVCLGLAQERDIAPAQASAAPVEGEKGRPLHLLLAEDNIVNQKVAVGLLKRQGHTIEVANNGLEALAALESGDFDLVLMDVQMPEMDGWEATQKIRADEAQSGGHMPIIGLTAHAMKGDRERCLEAGMDGYVPKPINKDELVQTIDSVLGGLPAEGGGQAEARPAETSVAETPVLDPEVLVDLRELEAGGHFSVEEFIEEFIGDTVERIFALHQAVAAGDAQVLERQAHTIKGGSREVGALAMGEVCEALEELGALGSVEGTSSLIEQLEKEFNQATAALGEYLQGGQ